MEYVAMLRARGILRNYAVIIFGLLALGLALAFKDGPPKIQMSHGAPQVPFDALLALASFFPLIIVAFLAGGLDGEYKTTAIAWTRPLSRFVLAARYYAVDAATVIAAWIVALAAVLIPIFVLGLNRYFTYSTDWLSWILLAFGCAVMWYGLIVFVAALVPGRGSAVVGMSWAYALIVPGLALIPFPPLLKDVMLALNYVNPLAYLTYSSGARGSILAGSHVDHIIATYAIGIVALAIGTRIWATREVPA